MNTGLSEVDIVNNGFAITGVKSIDNLGANTVAARLAKSLFATARLQVFDLPVNWKFATSRAQLTRLTTDPAFGSYQFQYKLPGNCVRVIASIDLAGDDLEYRWDREVFVTESGGREIETDVLLTDQEEVYIKYIRLRTNTGTWPGWFARLVSISIAGIVETPVKQEKWSRKIQFLWDEAWTKAQQSNSMEDARVNKDGVNLELGNTEVVDAGSRDICNSRHGRWPWRCWPS